MGEMPLMTDVGTFVINGTERVIRITIASITWCISLNMTKEKHTLQVNYFIQRA